MITTVLFDLDGTLLPMDQDVFTKAYFKLLAAKLAPRGYEPRALIDGIWEGTAAMVANDGSRTNETAFWDAFAARFGEQARADEPIFADFYANDFSLARESCGYTPCAAETVRALKARGFRVALATNPIFPAIATESRIRWAGFEPSDFALYTTYENATFCKPNPAYYAEILRKLGVQPSECLMVGNDATEDLAARELGIEVFLLTDCLINKHGAALTGIPHGDYAALNAYLASLN